MDTVESNATTQKPMTEDASQAEMSDRRSTSYADDRPQIMARLRRIEGQVRGVQRMVEEDQYCIDVLTQLSAIIAAAKQTGLIVLEDHIRGCVLGTCRHGHTDQDELVTELTEAIARFTRSAG